MKLLNLFKRLFKKKELQPREMVIFYGLPEELKLSKKNLIICDIADLLVISNEQKLACGAVNLASVNESSDDKIILKATDLNATIPESNNLKLYVSGIMYNPDTHVVEYTFSSEITDVELFDVDKFSFKQDNIKTTVISKETV